MIRYLVEYRSIGPWIPLKIGYNGDTEVDSFERGVYSKELIKIYKNVNKFGYEIRHRELT